MVATLFIVTFLPFAEDVTANITTAIVSSTKDDTNCSNDAD